MPQIPHMEFYELPFRCFSACAMKSVTLCKPSIQICISTQHPFQTELLQRSFPGGPACELAKLGTLRQRAQSLNQPCSVARSKKVPRSFFIDHFLVPADF